MSKKKNKRKEDVLKKPLMPESLEGDEKAGTTDSGKEKSTNDTVEEMSKTEGNNDITDAAGADAAAENAASASSDSEGAAEEVDAASSEAAGDAAAIENAASASSDGEGAAEEVDAAAASSESAGDSAENAASVSSDGEGAAEETDAVAALSEADEEAAAIENAADAASTEAAAQDAAGVAAASAGTGAAGIAANASGTVEGAAVADANDAIPTDEEKKAKRKKILKICGGVAAAIVAIYCIIALTYRSRFTTGTIINGIDASNMTVEQYEEALKEKVESYVLTMKFRNRVTEKIKGEDVGYTYVSDDGAARLLSAQNIFAWARGYFGASEELTVNEGCSFDEEKMTELAKALPELQFENMEVPTNAHLGVDEDAPEGEELEFEIVPETYGTQLIPDSFSEAVIDAAKSGVQEYDVDEAGLYVEPSIYSDDPYLKDSIGGFNEFLSTSITYDLPGGRQEVLDASVLKNWIAMREDGVQYLNEDIVREHVNAYVALLAMNVDDVHHERILHSTLQGDVSFDSDTWGHKIDQEAEVAALLADIQNHNVVEREPAYSLNWSYAENFGGTYIEVDIENQCCFYYEDGELCWSSECVTGTGSNPSRRTVRGVFTILSKQQGRTLRGPQLPDGSYTYESYVNYWMQFYEGYGLHDATWRSSYEFGGDTYWYSGSHGCVNLPYYAAESLYFMAGIGTYVLVF